MATIPILVGFLGLLFVAYLSATVVAKDTGTATMQELSGYIYEGAMAVLSREYKAIGVVALVVTGRLAIGIGWETAVAYIIGGICSATAGRVGIHLAPGAH